MDVNAALDDIERVVVDGDMRPEARERASRALEVVAAEVGRLRTAYAVFEELAPPDIPRKRFAEMCFAALEREAEPCRCVACTETLPARNAEVKRLTTAIHAATGLYRASLAIQPETLAGRMYDALAAVDGDDER